LFLSGIMGIAMIVLGGCLIRKLIDMIYQDAVELAKAELNGNIPIEENNI
jgi:hypothetical protein